MKVWPATVIVLVRELVLVFGATEKARAPPLVLEVVAPEVGPEVSVIQLAPLVAVQTQPVAAVTLTLPLPPVEVKEALEDESP